MSQPIRKQVKPKKNEDFIYTLLVDGNSVMKQSLVDKRKNDDGLEFGCVYQSLICIGNVLQKYDFNFCYVMFDGQDSGILRYNLYKDYKANRDKNYDTFGQSDYDRALSKKYKSMLKWAKDKQHKQAFEEDEDECFNRQREWLFQFLDNLFVRTMIADMVEGDDLIASYVKNKKPNERIVILTRDRDLTQLISDEVMVYLSDLKQFIHPKNHQKVLGYCHENVVVKKILCGDVSDNIKGIKGCGEMSLLKYFPSIVERRVTLDEIIDKAKEMNKEREASKKKPLKLLENIANSVTDGMQGDKIYDINKQIIDLSEPMLTKEASEELEAMSYAPMDSEGREMKNIFALIKEYKLNTLYDDKEFTNIFSKFNPLIKREKEYLKTCLKE